MNNKRHNEEVEEVEEMKDEVPENEHKENQESPEVKNDDKEDLIEGLKAAIDEKSKQCEEYYNKVLRAAAEFDNFKKRTIKEKESLYSEAVCDVVSAFLPVMDSIDGAIEVCSSENGGGSVKEGVEMVKRQIEDVMSKLGVEEIKSVGEEFDPEIHNAVMHVKDEQYGQNEVIEEFQKGYRYKDRIIRYSMVKVAN